MICIRSANRQTDRHVCIYHSVRSLDCYRALLGRLHVLCPEMCRSTPNLLKLSSIQPLYLAASVVQRGSKTVSIQLVLYIYIVYDMYAARGREKEKEEKE